MIACLLFSIPGGSLILVTALYNHRVEHRERLRDALLRYRRKPHDDLSSPNL